MSQISTILYLRVSDHARRIQMVSFAAQATREKFDQALNSDNSYGHWQSSHFSWLCLLWGVTFLPAIWSLWTACDWNSSYCGCPTFHSRLFAMIWECLGASKCSVFQQITGFWSISGSCRLCGLSLPSFELASMTSCEWQSLSFRECILDSWLIIDRSRGYRTWNLQILWGL